MKLKNRLLIYISAFFLIFALILLFVINTELRSYFKDRIISEQSLFSEYIAKDLDNRIQFFMHLMANTDITINSDLLSETERLDPYFLDNITNYTAVIRGFSKGLYLLDIESKEIISSVNSHIKEPGFFVDIISFDTVKTEKLHVESSVIKIDDKTEIDSFVFAVSRIITDSKGKLSGFLVGLCPYIRNISIMKDLMTQKIGKSGYYAILDGEVGIVLHPQLSKVSTKYSVPSLLSFYEKIKNNEKNYFIHYDEAGKEQLMILNSLSNVEWFLLSNYPIKEIYGLISPFRLRIFFIFAIFAIILFGVNNYIVKNLVTKIESFSEAVKDTNIENPNAIEDSSNLKEIKILVESYNKMITKIKKQYDTIYQSESVFNFVFENVQQGIAICELVYKDMLPVDIIFEKVNNNFAELIVQKKDNVVKNKASIVFPLIFKDQRNWLDSFHYTLKNGTYLKFDSYFFKPSQKWYSISALKIDNKSFVWMIEDITDRKNAELSVIKLNKCFLEFTSDPDINIDKLIMILGDFFNADAVGYFKLEKGQLLCSYNWNIHNYTKKVSEPEGQLCYEVIKSNDEGVSQFDNLQSSKYAKQDIFIRENEFDTCLCIAVKVFEKINGCLCVAFKTRVNINEHKKNIFTIIAGSLRIEEERKFEKNILEKVKNEAISANQAKSIFLANMSHEFRTPMNGILGMTELAINTDLSDEQKEYLSMIQYSAKNLLKLINRLLDLNQIEKGEFYFEEEKFSLRKIINLTVKNLSVSVYEKKLNFYVDIDNSIPDFLIGDSFRLHQVLLNLLSNALKFTEHGYIYLKVFKISQSVDSVKIQFIVQDTGIGIPTDKQCRIFSDFVQADDKMNKKYSGLGLGLSITRKIVRLMNGRIWVESKENNGSSFNFVIEFKILNNELSSLKKEYLVNLKNKKMFIFSADKMNEKILLKIFEEYPLDLTFFNNIEEVLRPDSFNLLDNYDIFIIDKFIQTDLYNILLEKVDRYRKSKNAKVLVLDTVKTDKIRDTVELRKVDNFIYKPVLREELIAAIEDCFSKKKETEIERGLYRKFKFSEKLSVLVVEDDEINQILAKNILESANCDVTVVEDGRDAVEFYKHNSPQLILMDIQMPVMDGIEATRLIRKNEKETNRRVKIIALTAHTYQDDIDTYLRSGFDDFIGKPVDKTLFLYKIKRNINS